MVHKPLLWLRMADCCMGVLQPQAQPADLHPELSGVATHIGTHTSPPGFRKACVRMHCGNSLPNSGKLKAKTNILHRCRLVPLLLEGMPFHIFDGVNQKVDIESDTKCDKKLNIETK